ncbi:hypothetical protein IQ255_01845 [Pleurocapsales cyanobacterium LEGE 10410]|nr:hypothetical protein [Pleurocapsales cyanobacterium LEGE 10410]
MLPKLPFPLNIVLFLALFLLFFSWVFSQAGWYELAELYKTNIKLSESIAQKTKSCTCRISKNSTGSFKGIIIAFLSTGLYLSPSILNTFIPSLLIPWRDISNYEMLGDEYRFYLGNPTITVLTLRRETVRELETISGIEISDRLTNN